MGLAPGPDGLGPVLDPGDGDPRSLLVLSRRGRSNARARFFFLLYIQFIHFSIHYKYVHMWCPCAGDVNAQIRTHALCFRSLAWRDNERLKKPVGILGPKLGAVGRLFQRILTLTYQKSFR